MLISSIAETETVCGIFQSTEVKIKLAGMAVTWVVEVETAIFILAVG
jgi:hypothetical protein